MNQGWQREVAAALLVGATLIAGLVGFRHQSMAEPDEPLPLIVSRVEETDPLVAQALDILQDLSDRSQQAASGEGAGRNGQPGDFREGHAADEADGHHHVADDHLQHPADAEASGPLLSDLRPLGVIRSGPITIVAVAAHLTVADTNDGLLAYTIVPFVREQPGDFVLACDRTGDGIAFGTRAGGRGVVVALGASTNDYVHMGSGFRVDGDRAIQAWSDPEYHGTTDVLHMNEQTASKFC